MTFAQLFTLWLSNSSQREPRILREGAAKRSQPLASAFRLESLETRVMLSSSPMELTQIPASVTAAVVTTNHPDYAPGETAVITTSNKTGSGLQFSAGETVRFQVTRTDGIGASPGEPTSIAPAGNEAWLVTDGMGGFTPHLQLEANGQVDWIAPDNDLTPNSSISTSWFVEEQYRGAFLQLTAMGQSSGTVANTAFTDENANTTTTVNSSATTSTYGNAVTFTATVTDESGAAAPTGSVEFFDGTTSLGSISVADSIGATTSTWSITTANLNAGTHASIHAAYTANSSFNDSTSGNTTQTVNKATATINVSGYSGVYDAAAHTATSTALGVLGETLSGLDLSGTTHRNAGSYTDTWTFTNANYEDASGTVSSSIEKALATLVFGGETYLYDEEAVLGYKVTYNGAAHTATGTAAGVLGETLSGLDLSGTTHTNAGTYTDNWTFTDSTGNYWDTAGSISSSIAKAVATVTVTGYTGIYDGAAHMPADTAVGLFSNSLPIPIQPGNTVLELSATGITNTSSAGVNGNNGSRYVNTVFPADQEAQVTVAGAPADGSTHFMDIFLRTQNPNTISLNSYYIGYQEAGTTGTWNIGRLINNSYQTRALASGTKLVAGDAIRASVVGDTVTAYSYHGGVWTAEISYAMTGADLVSGPGYIGVEISGASSEVRLTNVMGGGYTGVFGAAGHGAAGTAVGVLGESLSGLDLSGTTHRNAGSYTDSWTFTDVTGNYKNAHGTVTSNIDKALATLTFSGATYPYDEEAVLGYKVTYDGVSHTATGTAVGVLGESLSGLHMLDTAHRNAGTYTDSWTFTDATGNYWDTAGSISSTVFKATVTVHGYNGVYDKAAHGATGKGVLGESLSGLSTTTHTNAGTYTDTWTYTDSTGNYKNASGSVTNSITKAKATVTASGYKVIYNGVSHTATGTVVGVVGESLSGLNLSGTTHTNAGTYTDPWTFTDVTGNYKNAGGSVSNSIYKAVATVTVHGYTGVYDGTAHGATGTATGVGGVNLNAGLNLGATFINIPGGTSSWMFTGSANYKDKSGSVAIVISSIPLTATTTTVTSSGTLSTYGTAVTFTAVVRNRNGTAAPTGTVEFFDGATSLGILSVANSTGTGTATWNLTTTGLMAGTHASIRAVFTPTGSFAGSMSTKITQTVNQKTLTGSFTADNKTYDGSAVATVLTRTLTGVLAGDVGNVSLTGGAATFDNAYSGNNKTVTLSGATLVGPVASNYSLGLVSTTTASIMEADPTAPAIRVTNLANGGIVSSGVVVVEFSAANFILGDQGETHLNFYVDADTTPYRFFNGATQEVLYLDVHTHFVHWHDGSSIELHGLPAGDHHIRFALVDAADRELANTSAAAVLNFSVAPVPDGTFVLQPFVTQANFITSMAFAPDGRLFYTEFLTGAIRIVNQAGQLQANPWYQLTVKTGGEEGLLGLAIDPNFATNGFVYAYYTAAGPERNRIVRLQDVQGVGSNLTVILDNLPASQYHNGGKVKFGPDGKLYVVVGDTGTEYLRAQDLTFLGGKILRLNTDGSIPSDNPFPNSLVYSYGHRNSFGITFDPHSGQLWETENGVDVNDEINRIVAGGNYGWSIITGVANDLRFIDPIVALTPVIAPTGIAVISEQSSYPVEYHGNLFFADYNRGAVTRIILNGANVNQVESVTVVYPGGQGGITDLVEGPDGRLYVAFANKISTLALGSSNVGVISNIAAAAQADGTVLVTWNTNFLSDAQVEYGPTAAYGRLTPIVAWPATSHAVIVSGLAPGTTYHYRVRSMNEAGVIVASADATFMTLA